MGLIVSTLAHLTPRSSTGHIKLTTCILNVTEKVKVTILTIIYFLITVEVPCDAKPRLDVIRLCVCVCF